YSWSNGTIEVGTDATLLVTTPGTYTVTATAANGCTDTESITITQDISLPNVGPITGTTTVCTGNTTQLANATAGGIWSSSDVAVATVDANGLVTALTAGTTTISYAVTNTCGTTTVNTLVTVNTTPAAPTINAGGPTTFCQGDNVTLTSSQATDILWSTGATTSSINVTTSGNYTVTYTVNGCSATSAITTVTAKPIPVLTSPVTFDVFDETPFEVPVTSNVSNTSYFWNRAGIAGIAPSEGVGAEGSGIAGVNVISEILNNTSPSNINVLYRIVLTADGCSSDSITVQVTVNLSAPRLITPGTVIPLVTEQSTELKTVINVMPNPTTDHFNVIIKGGNTNNTVTVRVLDVYGTLVEKHEKIAANTSMKLGQNWAAGIYFIEVTQDRQRKVVRIIKTN
ncbi:MAG TPA: T9SS type A sorting domain-containing protein, partial [Chitinophagaceae bacterium]